MAGANVQSIEAIRDFRSAMIMFAQQVSDSLEAMKEQVFQAVDWIENDRHRYWHQQELSAYDRISETRVAYHSAKMRKETDDFRPALIEEKEAIRAAKDRLAYCQTKLQQVKSVAIKCRHEAEEFQGRMSQLERLIETDVPKVLGLMERMLVALEAYAETSVNEADDAGLPE